MKNILIIGSLNTDLVIYTDRMPQIGETIQGNDFMVNSGGKGFNQAVAVSKLGGNVKILGCVGNDANAEMLRENAEKNGVCTDGFITTDTSTGVAVITVFGGDNSIILHRGANWCMTPENIDKNLDLIKWADYVVFQFEIPMETVLYAAKIAKKLNKTVVVNPAPMCDFPEELLSYTDIFTPNRIECETLLKKTLSTNEELIDAVYKLQSMGISQVVITLGSDGCIYNVSDKVKIQPIVKTTVVDTTAAGDSFLGGFLVSIAKGKTVTEAVEIATYTSSIVVGRIGASKSIPTSEEVEELSKRKKE